MITHRFLWIYRFCLSQILSCLPSVYHDSSSTVIYRMKVINYCRNEYPFGFFFSFSVCEFANSHFFAEADVIFFAFLECIWFFLHSFQVSHWRDQNHNQITCERWLKKSLHFANKVALCISCTTILAREVTMILHLITTWKWSLENPGAFFFAVISKACFIAMTGDRHDEPAATDLSMIAVALTPTWLEWILTVMPVWLYSSSFLFFLFCFWTRNFICCTSFSCVWFWLPYVSLQSNWAWKPSKLGLSISFTLWGFSFLLTLYWRKLRRLLSLQKFVWFFRCHLPARLFRNLTFN